MFAIIGILIVILAVAGGYLMEKGHLLVLMQPAELLIIGGAAIGTLLIAKSGADSERRLSRAWAASSANRNLKKNAIWLRCG